ncbi:hypothetical protein LV779_04565 [Streptomyces thinghirensis]|nr:hypothetical protein [Streptomyces thinghirensis]
MTIPGETGNAVTDFARLRRLLGPGLRPPRGPAEADPRYVSVSCASPDHGLRPVVGLEPSGPRRLGPQRHPAGPGHLVVRVRRDLAPVLPVVAGTPRAGWPSGTSW